MDKAKKPPETSGSVPLNGGVSSSDKPFGGSLVNGKFVPNATGEEFRDRSFEGSFRTNEIIPMYAEVQADPK